MFGSLHIRPLRDDGPLSVTIDILRRKEAQEAAEIDALSSEIPWDRAMFEAILRESETVALAARNQQLCGFAVCRKEKRRIVLVNIAVHPAVRRRGVGTQLLQTAIRWLDGRINRLIADVPETLLPAQLFFKDCGFRAIRINHGNQEVPTTYRFVYRVD